MNVEIHNPSKLPLIDYRTVKPLQGELKDLSTENYQKLRGVLERRGFTTPLFLWKSGDTYYLMDGHQRHRVMISEKMTPYEVPYVLIEAKDEKDAKAQLLEITSQYGTITQEGFDQFIAEAELPEAEVLEAVNFDALQFSEPELEVEEDEVPEVSSEEPVSKLGEVYQLGRHRVMCGDSTNESDIATLMSDAKADMVFTDPPYGVSYESNKFVGKTKQRKVPWDSIKNDAKDGEELQSFLLLVFENMRKVCVESAPVYVWSAPMAEGYDTYKAIAQAGVHVQSQIIWAKSYMVLGRADFQWRHEPCWYGWFEGSNHYWNGGRTNTTVWEIDREPQASYQHPTQKPVALAKRALNFSCREDGIVLDVFLGSGSTLMAAEQLSRTCYGMEIDPKYVDVIRKRYAKHIGKEEEWEQATPAKN